MVHLKITQNKKCKKCTYVLLEDSEEKKNKFIVNMQQLCF